jgi:hypothetical protein
MTAVSASLMEDDGSWDDGLGDVPVLKQPSSNK